MKIFSVSELVSEISDYLELGLGSIAVQGEVSGFRVNHNKLVYFELKDESSRLLCFALTWEVQQVLEDGMEIKVLGIPKLFKSSGGFHVRVQDIELIGAGALQKQFELLKKKLTTEGLFSDEFKQPLPQFPESIGLITSRDAAAYQDVLTRLNERWSGLSIYFLHIKVQGFGAVSEITSAIKYMNTAHPVDTLILTRGGGSLEDLQAFNDERVVRAVFASKIPMIVGVGHERDVTLAELTADVRASTPTNAAERVIPHKDTVLQDIATTIQQLEASLTTRMREYTQHIEHMIVRFDYFMNRINTRYQTLMKRYVVALQGVHQKIVHHKQHIAQMKKMLESLNPKNVLKRGYSITYHNGRIIRNAQALSRNDTITTQLADGSVQSTVIK